MSGLILTNNARSSLAAAVATGDGTITLAAGDGAKFPVFNTAGQWHPVTVLHSDGSFEIMKVTGRTNDVLTVTRAQEGTAAQAFGIGDSVELRITGATMKDLIDGVATLQNAGYITAAQAPVQSVAGKTGTVTLSTSDISGMSSYALVSSLPTKVSQLSNDSGYLTSGGTIQNANYTLGQGNITAESGGTAGPGNVIQLRGVYSNGYPTTYGNLLHVDANGGQGQLLIGWSGASTAGNGISSDNYVRSLRDGHQAWSPWAKLWTDANLTKLSQLSNDSGFITSASLPTKTSQLTNDSGFITSGGAPVQSVAGKTGTVSLAKGDVGLGNVDNTADSTKSVASATKWNGANKTVSTAAPSGGADGDIWFQYS